MRKLLGFDFLLMITVLIARLRYCPNTSQADAKSILPK